MWLLVREVYSWLSDIVLSDYSKSGKHIQTHHSVLTASIVYSKTENLSVPVEPPCAADPVFPVFFQLDQILTCSVILNLIAAIILPHFYIFCSEWTADGSKVELNT